jgi:hypothetical protein
MPDSQESLVLLSRRVPLPPSAESAILPNDPARDFQTNPFPIANRPNDTSNQPDNHVHSTHAASGLPKNNQFFLPITNARNARSETLLENRSILSIILA